MKSHTDKAQENKSQAIANHSSKLPDQAEADVQFASHTPETIAQRKLQEEINTSNSVKKIDAYQAMANNNAKAKQLKAYQAMADNFTSQTVQQKENAKEEPLAEKSEPIQKKENNTGLPDNLKSGIESLSGMNMDHVQVHYNSDKPSQLQAHAYAQGSDIHVAPGQEKHLPHEAWHVVQQAQGRVKPTIQMKKDVLVNDDVELEHEADVMGEKALQQVAVQNSNATQQTKNNSNTGLVIQNQVIQRDRTYDDTLSPHKVKLMNWLVETNQTLGLSQEGESSTVAGNKKSNFSWHHILPFEALSKHGEAKTAPANHGGNLRLGPMKNRFESADVSGGTAVDYGYQPLDRSENIVLDAYSKGVFDGTVKATDKGSLTGAGKLSSETHTKTLQADNFTVGKEASVFGEWFLETQMKNTLLSKGAISGKLGGAISTDIDAFVKKIDDQFNGLLRTYKYFNKKKEVQITSGVPMTDISEGKFGHITVRKSGGTVKASTVIDELLRDQKWVKRGSQGELHNEETTYKFGLADHAPFITLIETAAKNIDLTAYRDKKLVEFKAKLKTEFTDFRGTGKEHDEFDGDLEDTMIDKMVENMKGGVATDYGKLWQGIGEDDVTTQYVKVEIKADGEDWTFPTPEVDARRDVIDDTDSDVDKTWDKIFVDKLDEWDEKTPLFDEESTPEELMYINFDEVGKSIEDNEQRWDLGAINRKRRQSGLPILGQNFLSTKTSRKSVETAVAKSLSDNRETYLSNKKEDLKLADVKEELKSKISPHYNVYSKRLKGVVKDLTERKTAFGGDFEGFINSTKWNVINGSTIPTDVDGTDGKKWAELGDVQTELYTEWLTQANVAGLIAAASTSEKLSKMLP